MEDLTLRCDVDKGLFVRLDLVFKCGHCHKKIICNNTELSDAEILEYDLDEYEKENGVLMIRTLSDIFTLVPPEAFENFMIDLHNMYVLGKKYGMDFSEMPFYNSGKNNVIITIPIPHTYEECQGSTE